MAANNKTTTIKLSKSTKNRLDNLKEYRRETYDEVLEKMLDILNSLRVSPLRARGRLIAIDRQKRAKRSSKPQTRPRIQQSEEKEEEKSL